MIITENKSTRKIKIEFDSIEDLSYYIKENAMPDSHGKTYDRPSFCAHSYAEAEHMLDNGWLDGISQMDVITRELEGSGEGEQTYIKYDVFGDFLNVGRFLSGEPECCGRFLTRKTKNGEVNILVNITAPNFTPQQTTINRGAAIQALVNKLLDNYYVNLQFIEVTKNIMQFKEMQIIVNVDTNNFYSREAIAFLAGNPAFLRRICFVVNEALCHKSNCDNYGRPADIQEKDRQNIDLYFPSFTSYEERDKWQTTESSKKAVKKIIQDYSSKSEDREPDYIPPPPKRVDPLSGKYADR